ncbi:hypothetical protein ACFLQN_03375 [Candidatus Aenigmatarchaeota archaeon]
MSVGMSDGVFVVLQGPKMRLLRHMAKVHRMSLQEACSRYGTDAVYNIPVGYIWRYDGAGSIRMGKTGREYLAEHGRVARNNQRSRSELIPVRHS